MFVRVCKYARLGLQKDMLGCYANVRREMSLCIRLEYCHTVVGKDRLHLSHINFYKPNLARI